MRFDFLNYFSYFQDAFNGLETVEHLKLDFLNLMNMVPYTFRGLFNCRKLTIDNSDLGTIQPKAMSGMLGVEELNIINSKIDKIHENVISEESEVWTGAIQDILFTLFLSGQNCQTGRKSSLGYPGRL